MTSFSIYLDVRRPGDWAEWLDAAVETFTMGAARCLLGSYTVVNPDDGSVHRFERQYAEAEWWHSPALGWELDAINPADRTEFGRICAEFVHANFTDLEAARAAIQERGGDWAETAGWAWYRLGMLLVHETNGAGVGYWEYPASRRLSEAARQLRQLSAWCHSDDTAGVSIYAHLD